MPPKSARKMNPMVHRSNDSASGSRPLELAVFDLEASDAKWLARIRRAAKPVSLGQLGDYELLEEVCRGAQGVVYRARRTGETGLVAVKRIIAGAFATNVARARFERELEAVAAIDHPNVVRAVGHDACVDAAILVMEWIDGIPIDQWADQRRDTHHQLKAILDVFLVACDAVHHAHQRGVIHRDLKPSNILVDVAHQPHLLDFGLAKMGRQDQADFARVTGTNEFLGTPAYAAPEQVRGEQATVDIRTDVYALGVILFRMLTGRLPFDSGRGLADLLADIQSAQAARPSQLNRALPDELDAIVGKAMARDVDRRYASVDGLAADLRRFLCGEAVEAKRGRRWYELRKAIQRHRTAATAVFTILVVVAGAASGLWMMYARQGRLLVQVTAARDAQTRAHQSARRQQKVLEELLAAAAGIGKGADLEVRRAWLDEAARLVQADLTDDPAAQATAHDSIGRTYQRLGLYTEAEEHLRAALELRKMIYFEDDPDFAGSLHHLGDLLQDFNRFAEAEPFLHEALAMRRRLFAGDHAELAESLESVGLIFQFRKDYAAAEELHSQALAMNRRMYGEADVHVAHDLDLMGTLRINQNRYHDAELAFRVALRIYIGSLGEEHRNVAAVKINLAKTLFQEAAYAEAETLFRESIATSRRLLGDRHDNVAWGLHRLGVLLHAAGEYDEAESTLRESLAIYRQCFGDRDPYVATVLNSLGTLQLDRGDLGTAKLNFDEAIAIRRMLLAPDDPRLDWFLNRLGEWYAATGDNDQAEPILRAALGARHLAMDVDSTYVGRTLDNLARLLSKRGLSKEAQASLEESLALRRAILGEDHPDIGREMVSLGFVRGLASELGAGRELIEQGLIIQRSKLNPYHPELARSLLTLARWCTEHADHACAGDALVEAGQICKQRACPPPSASWFWWPAN